MYYKQETNLQFVFEDPNAPKDLEEYLKRLVLEKMLGAVRH